MSVTDSSYITFLHNAALILSSLLDLKPVLHVEQTKLVFKCKIKAAEPPISSLCLCRPQTLRTNILEAERALVQSLLRTMHEQFDLVMRSYVDINMQLTKINI